MVKSSTFLVLQQVPDVEIISFSHNKIRDIKTHTFKYNLKLREIYLDNNELAAVNLDAFSHLHNLEKLVLHNNKLTQIPQRLPQSLNYLDLMNNLCGQITPAADVMVPEKLSYLNLCGNYLQNSTVFRRASFSNVSTLCIGDRGPQLPFDLTKNPFALARLQNLTLSARRNEYTEFIDSTARDFKKMTDLIELNLEYYRLKNVDFILPLDSLKVLRLENTQLWRKLKPDSLRMILQNKRNLTVLSLNGSPDLAEIMRPFFMCLSSLRVISLKRAGLITLRDDDFANGVIHSLWLDMSYNPLACDENFTWIHAELSNSTNFTLLAPDTTYCSLPYIARLTDFLTVNDNVTEQVPDANPRVQYFRDIAMICDVVVACLTIVPGTIFILYLVATRRNEQVQRRESVLESIIESPGN